MSYDYSDPATWDEIDRDAIETYLRSVLAQGCSPRITAFIEKKLAMLEETK